MRTMLWGVEYLLGAGLIGYLFLDFFGRLYGRRCSRRCERAVLALFAVLCMFINFLRLPGINLLYTMAAYFTIGYTCYGPNPKKFQFNLVFFLYVTLVDLTTMPLLATLSGQPLGKVLHRPFMMLFFDCVTKAALLCTYRLFVGWFRKSSRRPVELHQNLLLLGIFVVEMLASLSLVDFIEDRRTALSIALIGAGFLLLDLYIARLLETVVHYQELEARMEQSRLVSRNYEAMEARERQLRAMLHDIRNHLQALGAMEVSDPSRQEYFRQLMGKVDALERPPLCGNALLNVILTEKRALAESKGIRMELRAVDADWSGVQEIDMATIFANLLDNAIEACETLPDGERVIEVRIHAFNGNLVASVRNPYVEQGGGKPGHSGIGLCNVREAVEKYGGELRIQRDGGWFAAEIFLAP